MNHAFKKHTACFTVTQCALSSVETLENLSGDVTLEWSQVNQFKEASGISHDRTLLLLQQFQTYRLKHFLLFLFQFYIALQG